MHYTIEDVRHIEAAKQKMRQALKELEQATGKTVDRVDLVSIETTMMQDSIRSYVSDIEISFHEPINRTWS